MSVFLIATVGFSLWGIILAVLLDAVGFWLAIFYLLFVRYRITEFIGLQSHIDTLIVTQLVFPMLVGFFISRLSSFSVAKFCSFSPPLRD